MRRRSSDFNFWPSVADIMLVAFIILLGLWFGNQSLTKLEDVTGSGGIRITGDEHDEFNRLRTRLPDLERELLNLRNENKQLRSDIGAKDEELARARDSIQKFELLVADLKSKIRNLDNALTKANALNNKPPNFPMEETKGYKFESGTAILESDFLTVLKQTGFKKIREALDRGDVNTIEIIGHTDGTSVRSPKISNLDDQLGHVLSGKKPVAVLKFGSNVDLGLVRAVAVRRVIEAWLSEQKDLSGKIQVRCYSAANSVPLTDNLDEPKVFSGDEASRRRLEIRFTHLDPVSPQLPASQ